MKTLLIAEAGVNHNGDIGLARKLVDNAKMAGADIIKFQTFRPDRLVIHNTRLASYQKSNTSNYSDQYQMLSKLSLTEEEFLELSLYCGEVGIEFLSTPFDLESIDFLSQLQVKRFKIPSGEITNFPYLRKIGSYKKPLIISTGMATISEIEDALSVITLAGTLKSQITLLHCTTEYPAPLDHINLKFMKTLRKKFGIEVGYSDHSLGIEVAIAAVTLGATVLEKHFTLDKSMNGPDHKASLTPEELSLMISSIRNIERALGSQEKKIGKVELDNATVIRKSIVASCDIKKGDILTEENLSTKRPGTGISPMRWEQVLGTSAKRDFITDDLIEIQALKKIN